MRQLLILSGKGGTGKTILATAFIRLSEARAYADCDVDAPNLHLLMQLPSHVNETDYYGMDKARIASEVCVGCGLCMRHCRFEAVSYKGGFYIDEFACEGCGVCQAVCPHGAVSLHPAKAGDLKVYLGHSVFSTAQLQMGSGTSGLLVTEVKKNLKTNASKVALAIIDGSPGIGCPVIASISGVDLVLIVAEPSISGISDMMRVINAAENFRVPVAVCVNKYDTNITHTERIEIYCRDKGMPYTGRIPFDPEVMKAVNSGRSIVDYDCPSGRAVRDVYKRTMNLWNDK